MPKAKRENVDGKLTRSDLRTASWDLCQKVIRAASVNYLKRAGLNP